MRRLTGLAFVVFALVAMTRSAFALDPENTIYMELKDGRVVIELLPQVAPKTVERIKTLPAGSVLQFLPKWRKFSDVPHYAAQ